jgi:hypothetical protein
MADRFYINTTNLVTFTAGERPSADKFNAVNKYFSRGFESLAKVIGDAHDDGAPHGLASSIYLTNKWNRSSGSERPLDILNLARLIGPASNLNPRYLNRITGSVVEEIIPANTLEYYTNFPLRDGGISTPGILTLIREIDYERSMIAFNEPLSENTELAYYVKQAEDIEGGPNYTDAEFNVIPDPNTPSSETDYNLSITEDGLGGYDIVLPRIAYQQSKLLDRADSNIDVSDPNNNIQITLPKWMSGFQNGQVIPAGSIYIKDRTTGESFVDAIYTYVTPTQVHITNVELCLTEDHTFCLVTAGTDITTSIDDIRTKLFMHKHDGSFGESRISIYDLKDVFKYAPPSGAYKKSELAWNAVPQYLHRDGWQEGGDSFNGDNGMRGPLMMGLESFVAGANSISNDLTGTSKKIYFGGKNAFINRVVEDLKLTNTTAAIITDSPSLFTLNNIYNNVSESSFSISSNDNGNITTANTLSVSFKEKSLNEDLKYFDETVFVISEDGFNTPLDEFDHLNIKEENIGVKETVYKSCDFQFVTPAEYDLFDSNQYGAFSPTPSTIAGTDINQIVLVDGLHHFYDTSGGGNVLQEFATGSAQNQNTDSSHLISNYTSTSGNTEVTEFLLEQDYGSNYSISIKSAILPAKFNIRTWRSFVGNPPQAPNAGYGNNTLVIYDLAFKKPAGTSTTGVGAYRSSTWEIDRGYAWKANVFNNTRFNIENEYKNTFYIDFSPFPYWKWGLEEKSLPAQKIILDYRLPSLDSKCDTIKVSQSLWTSGYTENVFNGFVNSTDGKVELILNHQMFENQYEMYMSGLIQLKVEECFIGGKMYINVDPVIEVTDSYYKKFI